MCGLLYRSYFNSYHQIFLLWQLIFVAGIIFVLIRPLRQVSLDLISLTRLLEQRRKEMVDHKKAKETVIPQSPPKDPLIMVLDNQLILAKQQRKLTKNQYYLTKMLYYSLEVIRRVLTCINKKEEEDNDGLRLTEVVERIENYIKM